MIKMVSMELGHLMGRFGHFAWGPLDRCLLCAGNRLLRSAGWIANGISERRNCFYPLRFCRRSNGLLLDVAAKSGLSREPPQGAS